jgi:hypothetical protein
MATPDRPLELTQPRFFKPGAYLGSQRRHFEVWH